MLKTMREKTKLIIWITVIAFLVSLFFVFGDALRKKVKEQGVARVGDEKVSVQEFNQIYQRILNNREIPETDYPEIQTAQIMQDAYQLVVENKILEEISNNSDVKVSDLEIISDIQSIPAFRGPNGFDKNRYEQFLYNQGYTPKTFEQMYKEDLLMQRMKYLLLDFYSPTEQEVLYLFKVSNNKCIAEIINLNLEKFYDRVEYTDEDLKAFYNAHKQDYFVQKHLKVEYYYLPIIPSKEDEKEIRQRMEDILKRAKEGEDFAELARANSEGPSAENGGDLGYIRKGQTVKAFEDAAFSLKNGEISGIVKTRFGFHIIKKEDEKKENGVEYVKCRHILLKIEPSEYTKDQVHTLADELADDLRKVDDFKDIKEDYPTAQRKETDYFSSVSAPIPQLREAFNLPEDEKVDLPIPMKNSFLVYKILDTKPEYYVEFEKVEDGIKERYLHQESVQFAKEEAEKIFDSIKNKDKEFDLEKYCNENNLKYIKTGKFISGAPINYSVEGSTKPVTLNDSDSFSKDLFLTEDYSLSGPFKYENGFVIGRVVERFPVKEENISSINLDYFGRYMVQIFQKEFFTEWMEYKKNTFNVESFWNVKVINLKDQRDIEKVKKLMAEKAPEVKPVVEQETADTSYVILNHLREDVADKVIKNFEETSYLIFKELEINI